MNEKNENNENQGSTLLGSLFCIAILAAIIWGCWNWYQYGHVLGKEYITDGKLKEIAINFAIETLGDDNASISATDVSKSKDHNTVTLYIEYGINKGYESCDIWISKEECKAYYAVAAEGSPLMAKLIAMGWK